MGRSPGCFFAKDDDDQGLNRGAWTATEDKILSEYIKTHGVGPWRSLPKKSGLKRCRKSCRLRWLNYLRPDIKRGNISPEEEELLIRLHRLLGNRYALKDIIRYLNLYYRWSLIAGRLPGRTDNEIKNYWKTHFSRVEMGEFESTFQKPLQRRDVPYPDYDVESVVDKDNHTSQSTAIITTAVGYCAREVADIDNLDSYNNNHVVDTNDHDHVINQEENLKSAGDQVVEIDISKSWCQLLLDCLGDHQYDQLELVNCFQSNDITNSSYGTDHEHNQSPSLSP